MQDKHDVIISNGFNRFHLAIAASEIEKHNRLALYLTGAYPTNILLVIINILKLNKFNRIRKFIDRKENISENKISSLFFTEVIYELRKITKHFDIFSYKNYSKISASIIRKSNYSNAKIFHYRAGFGNYAAIEAKDNGLINICDFSIVHPRYIIGENYKYDNFWNYIIRDLKYADFIICNSDYVKESLINNGYSEDKIFVIYLGVDDKFIRKIPNPVNRSENECITFLFAGEFNSRKGGDILLKASKIIHTENWKLIISGTVNKELRSEFNDLISQPNVSYFGNLKRDELAKLMVNSDVFIFPTKAEGSARVVFEALACGLPVITTKEAGSIINNNVNGWIIKSNDAEELAVKINEILSNHKLLKKIRNKNSRLICNEYTQSNYGDKLIDLYDKLLQRSGKVG